MLIGNNAFNFDLQIILCLNIQYDIIKIVKTYKPNS